MPKYHIQCDLGDIGGYVILPGDPGRCEPIAAALDGSRKVAQNREYTTYSGWLDGVAVSVTSTGIGGPSAAIAIEELCDLGAHTLIRVGTAGAAQPNMKFGDLVIAHAAVRDEGTTSQYVPLPFPAVANIDVTCALRDAAQKLQLPHHVGTVQSKDSFYGETEPQRMPIAAELLSRWDVWVRAGTLASEMECAALFVVAAIRKVRAGAVLAICNEVPVKHGMPDPQSLPIAPLIDTAINAVRLLIARD